MTDRVTLVESSTGIGTVLTTSWSVPIGSVSTDVPETIIGKEIKSERKVLSK